MDKDQLFEGGEIESVLKLAAQLQNEKKRLDSKSAQALSLSELERIGEETGIDPEFIRQAVLLGDSPKESEGFNIWGANRVVKENLVIDRALTKTEREDLAPLIREIMGEEGHIDSLNNSMSWSSRPSRHKKTDSGISINVEGDKTIFKFRAGIGMAGFLIHYVGLMVTFLIALPFVAKAGFSLPGVLALVALLTTVFATTRFAYSRFAESRRQKMLTLKDALRNKLAPVQMANIDDSDLLGLEDLDYESSNSPDGKTAQREKASR